MAGLVSIIIPFLASTLGMSTTLVRFLLVYVATVPCAGMHRLIPPSAPPVLRHAYSAASGLLLSVAAFDLSAVVQFLVPVATTWAIMRWGRGQCGLASFLATFAFLIGCHVWYMSGDAWREGGIDFTGALMILTLKTTSCAFDYQDSGRRRRNTYTVAAAAAGGEGGGDAAVTPSQPSLAPAVMEDAAVAPTVAVAAAVPLTGEEMVRKSSGNGSGSIAFSTTESVAATTVATAVAAAAAAAEARRAARVLMRMPTLVEFLGYCFCCGSHFAGPFFTFADYLAWTEGRGVWARTPKSSPAPFALPLLLSLLQALTAAAVYLVLNASLDLSVLATPSLYFSLSFPRRALLVYHAGTVTRWKYYFIWSVSEAAMISSGLGFSGWRSREEEWSERRARWPRPRFFPQPYRNDRGEEASWDRAVNCRIVDVELASSAATFAINWNISVGLWLRTYVYERIVPEGRKPRFVHLLITQIVSAVWHGLYPGYLLFFSGVAWEVAGSRVIFRWQRRIPESASWLRFVAALAHGLFAALCNNFFAIGFIVLSAHETLTAWRGLYYLGIVMPTLAMAMDAAYVKSAPKELSAKRRQKVD